MSRLLGIWAGILFLFASGTSLAACDIITSLALNDAEQVSACDRALTFTIGTAERSFRFDRVIDQVFLAPDREVLAVRAGESVGVVRGRQITFLSTIEHLRKVLPLGDGGVMALLATPSGSKLVYLRGRDTGGVLWDSDRYVLDATRLAGPSIGLLSDDGLLEIVDLSSRSVVKTLPVAALSDRVMFDAPGKAVWVVQSQARTIQLCAIEGRTCGKPSKLGSRLQVLADVAGVTTVRKIP